MKKILLLSTLLVIVMTGFSQTKTIYLNSETVTCNVKGLKKECLQYKDAATDTAWKIYTNSIQGFIFNPGYLYTLQVRPISNKQPTVWKLVKTVSKRKSVIQQQPADSIGEILKPPAALVGQWNFTKMPADASVAFTKEVLIFNPMEMKVNGKASCNGFFGNYMIDGSKGEKAIQFGAIGHTMMACEALATENKMLKALELIDNWDVKGNTLYLKSGDSVLLELTRSTTGGTM